jgi:hypothetical protein
VAARSDPYADPGGRLGKDRGRVAAAGGAAEPRAGRYLWGATADPRRAAAAGAGLCQPGVPAAVSPHAAGRALPPALLRGGPGARDGRQLVDHRRSLAGTLGHRLCAGEPRGDLALLPGNFPRDGRAAAGAVPDEMPRAAAGAERRGLRSFARGGAFAGAAERDLFRACVSGALPGLQPGRGRRPDRARPARLPQDAGRAARNPRAAAQAGRRLLRPAGAAQRLDARRGGAGARGARGHCFDRQCARLRRAGVAGADAVPALAVSSSVRPGPAAPLRRHVVVRAGRRAAVCARALREHADQAGLPHALFRADPRRRAFRRTARAMDRAHQAPAVSVRRAGAGDALQRAGLGRTTGWRHGT